MNWKEFKEKVDAELERLCLNENDVEIMSIHVDNLDDEDNDVDISQLGGNSIAIL